ncbi:MAG: UDP-N-acetylmuramoyl-tripeptide--D-alanyl-D-alanine ligase [Chloroflexi bacterium]|nr:UDP-N-acetylmuramoyl-tripeptide--D-alanyl-D-alanine ligase [Chloroflexota bacterium]
MHPGAQSAGLDPREDRSAERRPEPRRPGGRAGLRRPRRADHGVPARAALAPDGGATVTARDVSTPVLNGGFVAGTLAARLQARTGNTDDSVRFERAIIDSREARPGDLFVALPGERTDGHDHAAAAVAAGASGCLLSRPVEGIDAAAGFIVDDTLASLQALGAAWRAVLPLEVLGITGSVGKTTTKAIAGGILGTRYRVQANPLNYNNEISVPLCLLELRPETERAVIELGMYTTGEIALLCQWVQPRAGIVLNVGPTHMERAGSIEAIARAKQELPEALPPDGAAILNVDDERVRWMAAHTPARVWWFGTSEDAEVRATNLKTDGAEGFTFDLGWHAAKRRVRVPLPGAHLVSNVLAAATAGLADGMTLDEVADAIEALDVPTRLRVIERADGTRILDDTYNAQPSSMIAALDLLATMPGRRIALLGDMLELGTVSRTEHERVGRRAAEVVTALVTVGEEARALGAAAREAGLSVQHAETRAGAESMLLALLEPGDAVLVKGSHALGLEHVVATLEQLAPVGNGEAR